MLGAYIGIAVVCGVPEMLNPTFCGFATLREVLAFGAACAANALSPRVIVIVVVSFVTLFVERFMLAAAQRIANESPLVENGAVAWQL